jgi:hypothetical protein
VHARCDALASPRTHARTCGARDRHGQAAEHHAVEEVQRDLGHRHVAELDEGEAAAGVEPGRDDGGHGVRLVARDGAQRLGEEELEHLARHLPRRVAVDGQ